MARGVRRKHPFTGLKKQDLPKGFGENPPIDDLDEVLFKDLCRIHCTKAEQAAILRVDDETLDAWCGRKYGKTWRECFEEFSSVGKMSLRRELFVKATSGARDSLGALVWLSKNHLGMSDKVETRNHNLNENRDESVELLVTSLMEALQPGRVVSGAIDTKPKELAEGEAGSGGAEGVAGDIQKKPV